MVLPDGLAEGAVLWGLALRCALQHPDSLARAGFAGAPPEVATQLFEAILTQPSGTVFAVDAWEEVLGRVATPDRPIRLALSDLLEELQSLQHGPERADSAFPFVLSAGERCAFTANTIVRNPDWRKKDADGALRISEEDAAGLGIVSGDAVRVTTRRGSAVVSVEVSDTMQPGHLSLPNGMGLENPAESSREGRLSGGIAPNQLTAVEDRDPFVGTPWHKHVAARLEVVAARG